MPCLNGYITKVGCQTVVFESRAYLIDKLDEYLKEPDRVESLWRSKAMHRELIDGPLTPECNPVCSPKDPPCDFETPLPPGHGTVQAQEGPCSR